MVKTKNDKGQILLVKRYSLKNIKWSIKNYLLSNICYKKGKGIDG